MAREIFGTDGIRARANEHPLTPDFVVKLGIAVGQYFSDRSKPHKVVIGKDTRRSGYMLENALTAGLTAAGMDVFLLGPMPTPAVGRLTHSMRADLGVMISASHNPYHDNGIKFFGPDGFKLSDAVELEIEAILKRDALETSSNRIGRAKRLNDVVGRYVEYSKTTLPERFRLDGLRVVIDCANGAAYKCAPEVLWELGAEVVPLGVQPDGFNINDGCGSTDTALAARTVRETRADVGICLDGDADRVMILDENGVVADGDQLMGLLAVGWAEADRLAHNTLVATVMSNLGLERHLKSKGITLKRTPVGDRYVVEEMRKGGFNLGGEQSGHMVMLDHATTGDGLIAALQVLALMKSKGQKASEIVRVFDPVPQKLVNVRFNKGQKPLETDSVKAAIAEGEAKLAASGRLLIRKSGTEPLIRVMGESEDAKLLDQVTKNIADAVQKAGH